MRPRTAFRRAPLLLEQPADLLQQCLMFLDLGEMCITKSVCRDFCRVARCLIHDVRWQGKHISLPRILKIIAGFMSYSNLLQIARRLSGLTTAEFDQRFTFTALYHPEDEQCLLHELLDEAKHVLLSDMRPWLSRAALARVRACPGEASHRGVVCNDCANEQAPLLPLHQALLAGLSDECVAALAAAHPPSPSWRLADLLRARQFGDASAIARLASHPEEVHQAEANLLQLLHREAEAERQEAERDPLAVTPSQLCALTPTFLHLASEGAPSAALVRRLLELDPAAAFEAGEVFDQLPLHVACCIARASWGRPHMSLEAFALLARANPAAVEEDCGYAGSGVTPLLAAAAMFPERVPVLLEVNPGAAAIEEHYELLCEYHQYRGMLPLHAACVHGNEAAIRALLEAYPEGARHLSTTGLLPHHCAARTGRVGALQLLVAAYPEGLHEQDGEGRLPIDETDVRTVAVVTADW